jgi:hypothetical protein
MLCSIETGPLSEYILAVISVLTLIYLYKTFKAQQAILTDQNAITKIELFKHLIDVRPKFSLSVPIFNPRIENDLSIIDSMVFSLKLNKNTAYRVEILAINNVDAFEWIIVPNPKYVNFLNANDSLSVFAGFKSKSSDALNLGYYLQFEILFFDIYDTCYIQRCTFEMLDGEKHIVNETPIIKQKSKRFNFDL